MNKSEKIKICLDMALCVLLVFCMGFQYWGLLAHEIAGTAMLLCFVLHNVLNRRWYMSLDKGKYSLVRIIFLVSVVLVFLDMLVLAYTGLVLSHYVFAFLPKFGNGAQAHRLHLWGSYIGMLVMSLHLGLHWAKFVSTVNVFRYLNLPARLRNMCARILAVLIAAYGAYVFAKNNCLDYLLFKNHFAAFDNVNTAFAFYIEYLAMLGTGIFLAHYCLKFVKMLGRS